MTAKTLEQFMSDVTDMANKFRDDSKAAMATMGKTMDTINSEIEGSVLTDASKRALGFHIAAEMARIEKELDA